MITSIVAKKFFSFFLFVVIVFGCSSQADEYSDGMNEIKKGNDEIGMSYLKIALFVTGFVLFPAYILHFFKIPISLDNISQILSFWGFGTFVTIAIWISVLKEADWRNYRREQMSYYKSRIDYYNSRSVSMFSSSYDNSFSNYDSDGNDSFSSLTNIDGTPMAGGVDINGNPYGVTS